MSVRASRPLAPVCFCVSRVLSALSFLFSNGFSLCFSLFLALPPFARWSSFALRYSLVCFWLPVCRCIFCSPVEIRPRCY